MRYVSKEEGQNYVKTSTVDRTRKCVIWGDISIQQEDRDYIYLWYPVPDPVTGIEYVFDKCLEN